MPSRYVTNARYRKFVEAQFALIAAAVSRDVAQRARGEATTIPDQLIETGIDRPLFMSVQVPVLTNNRGAARREVSA